MATQGQDADAGFAAVPGTAGARFRALRLSRRAKRGERSAFEEIFRTHHQELYRYCLAILRDRDDAEDALQATMAAALRSLPGEGRHIEVRPWLFRVAHNEAISILRRRRDEVGEEELADRAAPPHDDEIAT
ncbi:MAG TPA: RNA polymerase sigma factor, partial [Solirubrobacterales bacterium]|nr:RNA polymerase sigma factor [Solirubrobacterales bacterium]